MLEQLLMVAAVQLAQAAPADFQTTPVSPGSWSYRPSATGSEAAFVDSSATARLTVRCTRATRRVILLRTSLVPAATLGLWTTSGSRNLAATFNPATYQVASELAAFDPLLDGLAFSRGRIAVTMPGAPALVVPARPEIARSIEDCRI